MNRLASRGGWLYCAVLMDGVEADAAIHIGGTETKGHTVPAEILVKAVQGVQQLVWLAAAMSQERQLTRRFKPGAEFRRQFTLRLRVPQDGGYDLPAHVTSETGQMPIAGPTPADVLGLVGDIWTAIGARETSRLHTLIPDLGYRTKLLGEFKRFLPRHGDGWNIGFRLGSAAEVVLDYKHRAAVSDWLDESDDEDKRHTTVIGQLLRIDFAGKCAVIQYPPTGKEIRCMYLPDAEDDILSARRGLFQASGHFILDDTGHPQQLIDVRSFEPVNLAPWTIEQIDLPGRSIIISPPLEVCPRLDDETQQRFVASVPEFHIDALGKTRDELFGDVMGHLRFLWEEYAAANDESLAEDAVVLKRNLLARMREEVAEVLDAV